MQPQASACAKNLFQVWGVQPSLKAADREKKPFWVRSGLLYQVIIEMKPMKSITY
jgi:hypothetical protein